MRAIVGGEAEQAFVWVAHTVLVISFALEDTSWLEALEQVRAEAAEHRGLADHLRGSDDPAVKTVSHEDSAALVGLLLALAGIVLHQVTGSAVFDGLASLLIGVLLGGVAYLLGRTNEALLVGRQAEPDLVRAVRELLDAAPAAGQRAAGRFPGGRRGLPGAGAAQRPRAPRKGPGAVRAAGEPVAGLIGPPRTCSTQVRRWRS